MVTLIASLVGFISSIFPELLKMLRDRMDKKHELAILDRQMEIQKLGLSSRLEEIAIQADLREQQAIYATYTSGINLIDALNGTVRPVLAYAFFLLYMLVKYYQYDMIMENEPLFVYMEILWTIEDQAIFAGILSFYFGQRNISQLRRKK